MQKGIVAAQNAVLKNNAVQLEWKNTAQGWKLSAMRVKAGLQWKNIPALSGEYTLLFSKEKPDTTPAVFYNDKGNVIDFPEAQYRYIIPIWKQATTPVEMNIAGEAIHGFPSTMKQQNGQLIFTFENENAITTATWFLDAKYSHDVRVNITTKAKKAGYYSVATPTLSNFNKAHFNWAAVPGVFQGNSINNNFINAFAYGQGIPAKPVVVRERTVSTLSPLVTAIDGFTMAVIPDTGIGRNPWRSNVKTQNDWQLGLSVMNRKGDFSPTAYHPVLGEKDSYLKEGESISFAFYYTLQYADWYTVFKHAAEDVYQFNNFLSLKQTSRSLTDRILAMKNYVEDDSTSRWMNTNYKGTTIGAQAYLGGVYGSDKDAIKNADYGAMWMLSKISGDTILCNKRLPYARNFKLMQQQNDNGFFKGAAAGQYYLFNKKKFTEEWGPYSEPIGLTYYMMMDIGNILLFEPKDTALINELRLAANKIFTWMKPTGQWEVAYDNEMGKPMFTDVEDFRPTFYGLLIAYKLLRDKKYLDAARRGADWFINNAVNKGRFLGVCGDTRFMADFATGQSVQALLDLYDVTKEEKYKVAALKVARIYTTSVYTHPVPTKQEKTVNGIKREDWAISQAGLSFEHGGILGSANSRGPILLASHAGMFVRLFQITKDSLYLNMARAAALGRDAFVDEKTGVASYYWDVMNKGAGPYPHHAWWQIGWITDYLLSEAALRSNNQVLFPSGFITPKVGPHKTYGFAAGSVFGTKASLLLKPGLVNLNSPYIDYYCAINEGTKTLFIILLNNDDEPITASVTAYFAKMLNGKNAVPKAVTLIDENGLKTKLPANDKWQLNIKPYGLKVIAIDYE